MEQYGALDVSLGAVSICLVEADGRVAAEGVTARDPAAIAAFVRLRAPRLVRLGLETGPFTVGLAHALRELGLPAEVMEARQANQLLKAMSRHKNDRRDARGLAELVRLAAYKPVALKSLEASELRALLAARGLLAKQEVQLASQLRGLMRSLGLAAPRGRGAAFAQAVRESLAARPEFALLGQAAEALLAALAGLARQSAGLDRLVKRLARERPEARLLMSAPAIGPVCALAFLAAVEDLSRFRSGEALAAWLGLVPRQRQSGGRDGRAGVGREGDKRLRALLYEAGQVLLHRVGRWTKLKAWGLKLVRRVGHKKAGVALARKLAILLYALSKRGEPFRWAQA
jgi:transposase